MEEEEAPLHSSMSLDAVNGHSLTTSTSALRIRHLILHPHHGHGHQHLLDLLFPFFDQINCDLMPDYIDALLPSSPFLPNSSSQHNDSSLQHR
ncbi:hypothetical protein TYRP_000049 [Tyrophagus putrescentiae]|nr:hypothetical protein TYRP_000049 [Tyrophagus putrescentiae]